MRVTRDQIYSTLSNVLTDYEEGEFGVDEQALYDILVEIQNRWEDTITCDDSQSNIKEAN